MENISLLVNYMLYMWRINSQGQTFQFTTDLILSWQYVIHTGPFMWWILLTPLCRHIMMMYVIMQWSIKFRSNKIHIKCIPEWSKWIPFFCITSIAITPRSVAKSWHNNKTDIKYDTNQECTLILKNQNSSKRKHNTSLLQRSTGWCCLQK